MDLHHLRRLTVCCRPAADEACRRHSAWSPLIGDKEHVTPDVADEKVEAAVPIPIYGVDRRSRPCNHYLLVGRALDALAMIIDDRSPRSLLELCIASDQDVAVGLLMQPAADIDDVSIFVLEHFGGGEGAARTAAEEKDFAGPGAGDDVGVAVAIQVHQLGTKTDASARRHAAVFVPAFEFHSSR